MLQSATPLRTYFPTSNRTTKMTRIILRPQPPDAIQKDPLGSATNPIPRHGPFSSKLSNMKGVYVVDFRAPMPRDYFAERNQLKKYVQPSELNNTANNQQPHQEPLHHHQLAERCGVRAPSPHGRIPFSCRDALLRYMDNAVPHDPRLLRP